MNIKRKYLLISLIIFLVSIFAVSLNVYARVHTYDNHISYDDYQTSYFSNLRSPFRNSSGYDIEYPINEKYQQPRLWSANDTHEGIDFSSPKGTNAYAVWKSKVTYVSPPGTPVSSTYIVIQLDLNSDGIYSENVYAVYEHMLTTNVTTGQELTTSNIVGTTGYYGSDPNAGIHLHFGLTKNTTSNYLDLIWTPSYNFYKNSSLYNYGKDFDYLYNYVAPSSTNSDIKISGYHKPDSSTTRNVLEYIRIYHRPYGSTGSWQYNTMTYLGSFNYKVDVYSLGYSPGTQIEYLFVGKAANSSAYYAKVGYYPAKFYIPPEDPNSQSWLYSKYAYTIPLVDSFEPNETKETSKIISKGSYYTPSIHRFADVDWYNVYTSSGVFNVQMYSIPPSTDYDLYLYNSSGQLIGSSENGGNANELITITVTSGTYYIKVISYYGCNTSDTYTLKTY